MIDGLEDLFLQSEDVAGIVYEALMKAADIMQLLEGQNWERVPVN